MHVSVFVFCMHVCTHVRMYIYITFPETTGQYWGLWTVSSRACGTTGWRLRLQVTYIHTYMHKYKHSCIHTHAIHIIETWFAGHKQKARERAGVERYSLPLHAFSPFPSSYFQPSSATPRLYSPSFPRPFNLTDPNPKPQTLNSAWSVQEFSYGVGIFIFLYATIRWRFLGHECGES
jgi:hypothetical protein